MSRDLNINASYRRHIKITKEELVVKGFVDLVENQKKIGASNKDMITITGILVHNKNEKDTYARIDGVLLDEEDSQRDTFHLMINIPHEFRFKKIYAENTTADYIIILGQ